eukprot:gene25380-31836_t
MGGKNFGKLGFTFAGATVNLNANAAEVDSDVCQKALGGLQSVVDVTCVREDLNIESQVGSYLITLNKFPTMPFMNNLVSHSGNPAKNLFSCNTTLVDEEEAVGAYCRIYDMEPLEGLPVYGECSMHGSCDRVYGKCACERGFKGVDCQDMRDDKDITTNEHDGPFFTASLLKLNVLRDMSPVFNLFTAQVSGRNVTTITGDGKLVQNGDVLVQSTLQLGSTARNASEKVNTNLHSLINTKNTPSRHHIEAVTNGASVFSVDSDGNTDLSGDLAVGGDANVFSVDVKSGVTTARELHLTSSLEVTGSVNVQDALTIGTGFALTPGGMTVDVATHTGTLFELRSRQPNFNGSLLELHSAGDTSSMIKTVSDGMTTFELSSSGHVKMQGLRLTSGGIQVDSGGVQIASGGLNVKGGLTLESGDLNVAHQQLNLAGVHVTSNEQNLDESLLSARVQSVAPRVQSDSKMNFISCAVDTDKDSAEKHSVFSVDVQGNMQTAGGVSLSGGEGLEVKGSARLLGDLQVHKTHITPQLIDNKLTAVIPHTASYVVITDFNEVSVSGDTSTSAVEVVFEGSLVDSPPATGRVVIVTNLGTKTTTGAILLPSLSTVLLVFNGQQWVDVEALKAPMHVLKNVRTFEAAADLNIGPHTLTAQRLAATAIEKGRVLFTGSSGLLIDSDKFSFVKGVLSVPSVKFERLVGSVDAKGNEISNVVLLNAKLESAIVRATELTISGQSGLAYFNNKGLLTGSSTLTLDSEGHLMISELFSDVTLHGHVMRNVTLSEARLDKVKSAEIESLKLTGEQFKMTAISGSGDGLLVINSEGDVHSSSSAVTVDSKTNTLHVNKLHAATLTGPLDTNHQELKNVNIVSGKLSNIEQISVKELTVSDLAASTAGTRVVFTDSTGKLQAHTQSDSSVAKNIKFDHTVDFGRLDKFDTNSLRIRDLSTSSGVAAGRFLTASSAEGQIDVLASSSIVMREGNVLDIGTGSLHSASIKTNAIQITSLSSSTQKSNTHTLLGADSDGNVVRVSEDIRIDSVTVSDRLEVGKEGTLHLHSLQSSPSTPSFLAVNSEGRVIGVNSEEGRKIKLETEEITTSTLTSTFTTSDTTRTSSLYLTTNANSALAESQSEGKTEGGDVLGNILIREK